MRLLRLCGLGCLALLLLGCATSIPVTVTRPAEVDMSEHRQLAVFRIRVVGRQTDDALLVSQRLTDMLTEELSATEYFTLYTPQQILAVYGMYDPETEVVAVSRAIKANAVIRGNLTYTVRDTPETRTQETRDPKTGRITRTMVRYNNRSVNLDLAYQVLDAQTGQLIAAKTLSEGAQRSTQVGRPVPSPGDLAGPLLRPMARRVSRQLAPYTAQEYRVLMKDERDAPESAEAARYAKGGEYQRALDVFLQLWRRTKNVSAGVNAAILYEVMGDVDRALAQIDGVLDVSSDRRVLGQKRRLEAVKADREAVERQQ